MFVRGNRSRVTSSVRTTARSTARALSIVSALLLLSASLPSRAEASDASLDKVTMTPGQFATMDPMKAIKVMDGDGKGYVTREEFLKFQEKLFNNIQKQQADRVSIDEWRKQATLGAGGG